jgi:hypothetical protein
MGLDFGALVLGPTMAVFSDPIALTPTVSIPGALAYPARGIFAQRPTRWETAEGGLVTTMESTLGIMLADFPVPPRQGDSLVRAGVTWFVWDVNLDGQGGASLSIKQQRKPAE